MPCPRARSPPPVATGSPRSKRIGSSSDPDLRRRSVSSAISPPPLRVDAGVARRQVPGLDEACAGVSRAARRRILPFISSLIFSNCKVAVPPHRELPSICKGPRWPAAETHRARSWGPTSGRGAGREALEGPEGAAPRSPPSPPNPWNRLRSCRQRTWQLFVRAGSGLQLGLQLSSSDVSRGEGGGGRGATLRGGHDLSYP